MNAKTRYMIAALALAVSPTLMVGCGGTECGAGTIEQDGKCVPETTCGDNTTLVDGKCVLDAAACEAGTTNMNGTCVPTADICNEQTTFDAGTGTCVPNWSIACGTGTSYNMTSGKCEPSAGACAAGSELDAQGRCVVAATACGAGSALDANTGKCVAGAASCGANTALSDGVCKPIASVCNTGTTFDTGTGVCLPDVTCKEGDLILNGECVPAREQLASRVDVTEQENNDPMKGGTAETLAVKAVGDLTVFAGAIGAPADLDGDDSLDQDVDVYTFTATAGQTFELSVQPSPEAPLLSFVVMGPDGWMRYGTFALSGGTARKIVIPADGDYSIAVAPASWFLRDDAAPQGAADASYIGTLEQVDAITATDFNITSGPLQGQLADLDDNLFKLSGVTSGVIDIRTNSLGSGVEKAYISFWTDAQTFVGGAELVAGESTRIPVPTGGDVYALVDWGRINSTATGFDLTLASLPYQDIGAVSAGTTKDSQPTLLAADFGAYYTFNVQAGEVIELTQTNNSAAAVAVEVRDSAGATVFSRPAFAPGDDATPGITYIYAPAGGDYTVVVNNTDTINTVDALKLTVRSITPSDLGALAAGGTIAETDTNALSTRRRVYYRASFATAFKLAGTLAANNLGDPQIYAYVAVDGALAERSVQPGNETFEFVLGDGEYLFAIESGDELDAGYNLNAAIEAATGFETEPNNTAAEASTITLNDPAYGRTVAGDADFFTLNLAAALGSTEVLLVDIVPSSFGSQGKLSCTLRDSGGTVVAQTLDFDNRCGFYAGNLAAGDYTVELTSDLPATTQYTLTASTGAYAVEIEPNEDTTSATTAALPSRFLATLAPGSTDVDTFKFTVSANYAIVNGQAEGIRVALGLPPFSSGDLGDIGFELLDDTGAPIRARGTSLDLPLLPAGEYYIRVTRTDSDASIAGNYQLEITEELFSQGQDGGDTCETATPIFTNGTFSSTYANANNDYSPSSGSVSCTGYTANGLDVVYYVDMAAGQTLNVSHDSSTDSSLYIVTDCADVDNTCLDGDDGGDPEQVSYTATAPIRVFIIADLYSNTSQSTTFDLTVDLQ